MLHKKELILILVGAVVLANVSVLVTLWASGFLGGDSVDEATTKAAEAGADSPSEAGAGPAEPEQPESRVGHLQFLSEAIELCDKRLREQSDTLAISYDVNNSASRFYESEGVFRVFMSVEPISRPGEEAEPYNVVCEVSASERRVTAFTIT